MYSRAFSLLSLLIASLAHASPTPAHHIQDRASNSFAGVNSFFLHAFQQPDRLDVLDAVQAAGLKYIRLFISYTEADFKSTGSVLMPDIEPIQVGTFDDTQLKAIDQLMVEAHERNIKLTIAMHDRYQLGCWGNDTYVSKYHLPAVDCNYAKASANNVEFWYSDANCINDFQRRIQHILQHRNELVDGSPQWKDMPDHIFSFNIQNEGQGHLKDNIAPHPRWWCDRAAFMRGIMGSSSVLISTGGGNEFPNSDIPENWACEALDLVDIHSYGGVEEFRTKGPIALQHALDANKLMLFEEFGATGDDKADVIGQHIDVFNNLRVPWSPWQISKPGKGTADYEFWTDEPTYGVVKDGSEKAQGLEAAQEWAI